MEYRQNNDTMCLCAEINAIWKTIGDDTPNVFAHNGKLEGMFRYQRHTTLDLCHEIKCKAGASGFIPHACFDKLRRNDGK